MTADQWEFIALLIEASPALVLFFSVIAGFGLAAGWGLAHVALMIVFGSWMSVEDWWKRITKKEGSK